MRDDIRVTMATAMILILGLSTPGWSAGPSKFDAGNKGTSALGQLEDMAGQKVDTSSPGVSTIDTYKKKITLPQKAAPKPKVNQNAAMNAMVTGMVMGSLLEAVFSDNSQQRAYEEAARAMAEAEQKRIAEEQRKQRIASAGKLRSFWDGRDEEMSESLGDVFSVPGQGQGTAFFGIQSNPNVKPSDLSGGQDDTGAVALQGPNAKPTILGTGAPDVMAPSMTLPSESFTTETSSLQDRIIKSGSEFAQDIAQDAVKDIAKDLIKSALPTSAHNAELMVEYVDKMNEFTKNLFKAIEAQRLVGTLANGGPGDYQAIMDDLDKVMRQGTQLGLGESPFSDAELKVGFNLLNGKSVNASDVGEIMTGKWKGFLSEELKDRLTEGWM
ncbi:MAG TPA: hypothetical protein PLA83_02015 [Deltaproteobacteria bacterium]|nr:hypothetical protein [Deltaproteobacteria bacterium]